MFAQRSNGIQGSAATIALGRVVPMKAGKRTRDIILYVASAQRSMLAIVDEKEVEMVQQGGFWILDLPARRTDMPTVVNFR